MGSRLRFEVSGATVGAIERSARLVAVEAFGCRFGEVAVGPFVAVPLARSGEGEIVLWSAEVECRRVEVRRCEVCGCICSTCFVGHRSEPPAGHGLECVLDREEGGAGS